MSNPKKVTVVTLALLAGTAGLLVAGPLNPPVGSVASTFKTLAEVEPRIAVNATNTPGDADATPSTFKISQPGAYYLTGNITGEAGKHGIEITSVGVTLDLNGFSVVGVPGSLTGVALRSASIEVRGGTVRNFTGGGVISDGASTNNRVIDVRAIGNTGVGIYAGIYSETRNCLASSNGSHGISLYAYCRAEGCTTQGNGGDGINGGNAGSIIINCVASNNSGRGIYTNVSNSIIGCTVQDNVSNGIETSYSIVKDCTSGSNDGYGIQMGAGSMATNNRSFGNVIGGFFTLENAVLEGNMASSNGNNTAGRLGFAISGANVRLTNNHASNNPTGFSVFSGPCVLIGNTAIGNSGSGYVVSTNTNTMLMGNISTGSATNYNIGAGNDFGAVLTNPGVGFASTNSAANFAN